MQKYTLKQVKGSLNRKLDDSFIISKHFLRPISFYITYFMLKLNIKPNQATVIGLLLGVAGLFCFLNQSLFFWGFIFYLTYRIFDFVDGNISRITNSATYYGKFLDGAVDVLIEALLPLFIGIGMSFASNRFYLFTGIVTSLSVLYANYLLNRASFYNRWVAMTESAISHQSLNPLYATKIPIKGIVSFSIDFSLLILAISIFAGLSIFLFILFILPTIIWSFLIITAILNNSRKQLDIHRVSRLQV